jgi:hypothetical protein
MRWQPSMGSRSGQRPRLRARVAGRLQPSASSTVAAGPADHHTCRPTGGPTGSRRLPTLRAACRRTADQASPPVMARHGTWRPGGERQRGGPTQRPVPGMPYAKPGPWRPGGSSAARGFLPGLSPVRRPSHAAATATANSCRQMTATYLSSIYGSRLTPGRAGAAQWPHWTGSKPMRGLPAAGPSVDIGGVRNARWSRSGRDSGAGAGGRAWITLAWVLPRPAGIGA